MFCANVGNGRLLVWNASLSLLMWNVMFWFPQYHSRRIFILMWGFCAHLPDLADILARFCQIYLRQNTKHRMTTATDNAVSGHSVLEQTGRRQE